MSIRLFDLPRPADQEVRVIGISTMWLGCGLKITDYPQKLKCVVIRQDLLYTLMSFCIRLGKNDEI